MTEPRTAPTSEAPVGRGPPVPAPVDPDTPSADIRIGYARRSTLTRELQARLDALAVKRIPRGKIFSEGISTRVRVRPRFEAARAAAREVKAHAPHCRVIRTVYEMKRLGRGAAELAALADHLTAQAETGREGIREAALEGLDTAVRKGNQGGRPSVITDDMLHTVLRRRANGETVEDIRPDLLVPVGRRNRVGRGVEGGVEPSPSLSSIYRALAEHEKARAHPEAVEAARAGFAALQQCAPVDRYLA